MSRLTRTAIAVALFVPTIAVTGCTAAPQRAADGKLTVAAAFFPIEEIVRQVGGDNVDVVELVPRGQEAHDYELSPQQAARLEQSDVVFYLGGGFQPDVEKVIAGLPDRIVRVDLLQGLDLLPVATPPNGDMDPHVWLDPANMQAMTDTVTATLTAARSSDGAAFTRNGAAYDQSLGALDQRFTTGLASCSSRLSPSSTSRASGP